MEFLTREICEYCKGTGKNPIPLSPSLEHDFYDNECPKCKGVGKVQKWIDSERMTNVIKYVIQHNR
jgi:DnaJ-class molecular chaperone